MYRHHSQRAPITVSDDDSISVPGSEHGLSSHIVAIAFEQLPDLIHNATQAVVTLKGHDNFNSESMHSVSVKNLLSGPLVGQSFVIVLDRVTKIVSALRSGRWGLAGRGKTISAQQNIDGLYV